jgi:hypothetical protein
LPGTPGGRPLTEEENKFRKEFAGLSPADRTAIREGFTAAATYMQLGGNPADLVDECSQAGGGQRAGEHDNMGKE